LPRVHVRQHVNPLSHKYRTPIALPDWNQVYRDTTRPIHLDIGCARGRFLLQMAELFPEINFLGIEIREPLVIEANQKRERLDYPNLYFLFCNINVVLEDLLQSLPAGKLQRVSIQFPDPWFKLRHRKRRVVQPELVQIIARFLAPGGIVFLQSDVEAIAQEMSNRFAENPHFIRQHEEPWLAENIFPVSTEREIATYNKGEKVYRSLFTLADKRFPC
jgi:tRNA (guanine-N7-)-methyltransferase